MATLTIVMVLLYGGKSCLRVECGQGRMHEIPRYNLARLGLACLSRMILFNATKRGRSMWTRIQERTVYLPVSTT